MENSNAYTLSLGTSSRHGEMFQLGLDCKTSHQLRITICCGICSLRPILMSSTSYVFNIFSGLSQTVKKKIPNPNIPQPKSCKVRFFSAQRLPCPKGPHRWKHHPLGVRTPRSPRSVARRPVVPSSTPSGGSSGGATAPRRARSARPRGHRWFRGFRWGKHGMFDATWWFYVILKMNTDFCLRAMSVWWITMLSKPRWITCRD